MFSCNCCPIPKSYTELRNLYRHQRKYQLSFVEPKVRTELQREYARQQYYENPRRCLHCNEAMSYKDIQEDSRRKYCSQSCAGTAGNLARLKNGYNPVIKKYNAEVYVPKKCQHCSGKLNSPGHAHNFCSLTCCALFKRGKKIQLWLNGEISGGCINGDLSVYVREYILKQAGHKCSECGWSKVNPTTGKIPLTVDHVDGDSTNHRPENLKVLCPSCHSLTPTYGSLNNGKGREQRRLYRKTMKETGRPVA